MKKIALITGASRGIGASTAQLFAQNGYTVIINYNNSADQAKKIQKQLIEQGCDAHILQADVSNVQQAHNMFDYIDRVFHHVDVLVNNAGIWRGGLIQDVNIEDYNAVMDTNARGVFLCCKRALPLLLRGDNPTVVNVSSIWGVHGSACESVYCMSKYAVVGLSTSLAQEWKDIGINVNCICPPMVQTDMCAGYTQQEIDQFCQQSGTSLYTPSQVAQHIFQLATEKTTGVVKQLK